MNSYKIAVIQLDSQNDKMKNLKQIETYIDEAAKNGAVLISLPEDVNLVGKNVGEGGNAEPAGGLTETFFRQKAQEHGIYLHCGSFHTTIDSEYSSTISTQSTLKDSATITVNTSTVQTVNTLKSSSSVHIQIDNSDVCKTFTSSVQHQTDKRAYNTSMFFSPKGEKLAEYHKLHTFDITLEDGTASMESASIKPGESIATAKTDLGTFGFSICYDIRFPELYRLLALQGAEIIFAPADFTDPTGKAHWEILLRARAIENSCYIIAADQCGQKPRYLAHGNSMIIDPWGNILARADDKPGILYSEIDLDLVKQIRNKIPSLKNRRSDIYTLSPIKFF